MRDYRHIDAYLNNLQTDIYPQPDDAGHTILAHLAIQWFSLRSGNKKSVLDVGCGTGFCQKAFENNGYVWKGLTLGADPKSKNQIISGDFSFLSGTWDIIFARHVLEHSPFPLITLMEWRRVAQEVWLVLPAVEFWRERGQNHYFVLNYPQWWSLLTRAGWQIMDKNILYTDDTLFLKSFRLDITDVEERKHLEAPGAPMPYEYWLYCVAGSERIT